MGGAPTRGKGGAGDGAQGGADAGGAVEDTAGVGGTAGVIGGDGAGGGVADNSTMLVVGVQGAVAEPGPKRARSRTPRCAAFADCGRGRRGTICMYGETLPPTIPLSTARGGFEGGMASTLAFAGKLVTEMLWPWGRAL